MNVWGFLTVTGVETSPDLRHAMVYFDSLSDEAKEASRSAGRRSRRR
jgi:ribosome-binding factor A